jgi:Phosphotransferase enzyme family
MQPELLGELPRTNPLYEFLAHEVMEKELGYRDSEPTFEIYSLDGGPTVYLYADRQSLIQIVCKFYGHKMMAGSRTGHHEVRAAFMHKEFESLKYARSLGLNTSHHNIVRPLAINEELDFVLVEEFAPGNNLVFFVMEALQSDCSLQLRERVSEAAGFLADLHNRSMTKSHESRQDSVLENLSALDYLRSTADGLVYWQTITSEERHCFDEIGERWAARSDLLKLPHEVVVHGDANPTNFLWREDNYLTVIDLERLSWGDRAFDLGFVAAELKHLFWCHSGNAQRSEPYIQHLYATYFDCLSDGMDDFTSLTTRGRFYMGCIEMRIARNTWLDFGYRRSLVEDAQACLRI